MDLTLVDGGKTFEDRSRRDYPQEIRDNWRNEAALVGILVEWIDHLVCHRVDRFSITPSRVINERQHHHVIGNCCVHLGRTAHWEATPEHFLQEVRRELREASLHPD